MSRSRRAASGIRQWSGITLPGTGKLLRCSGQRRSSRLRWCFARLRPCSGRLDILIIAVIALLLVGALIFVLLQLMGQSEEHVEKVRKTKVAYKESLRWRSENELGESRIRRDLEQDPNRLKLDYGDTNLNESCLKMIGRMSKLQELRLTRSTVKSSWLAHITDLPLRNLGLHGTPIGDKAIRYILMIPTLIKLEIGDTNVSDEGLKQLSESRCIRYLSLSVGRRITNNGIKHIGKMPQLVSLELDDSTVVDGKCLAYLTDLSNLNNLNLESVELTEEDLRPLASLKNLRTLNVGNCQLDDSSIDEIMKVSSLISLNVAGNNFTDKGLSSVSKLTNLVHLTIKACPNVTGSCIKELRAALPNCTIIYGDTKKYAEKMSRTGVKNELQLLENEAQNELEKSVVE